MHSHRLARADRKPTGQAYGLPRPRGHVPPTQRPYSPAVMLTNSSDCLSPSVGGLGDHLASRCGPLLQPVCNTVDVADRNDGGPLRRHLCADVAYDISAPNGDRIPPTLELVLHVCCTQADLIMFSVR